MGLLYAVELLVEPHCGKGHQKYSRPDTEHAHRDGKPVDLGQQFRLLLVHVRTRVIQKQLIIPVHGECALVDQEEDQTDSEYSEDHRYNCEYHNHPVGSACYGSTFRHEKLINIGHKWPVTGTPELAAISEIPFFAIGIRGNAARIREQN